MSSGRSVQIFPTQLPARRGSVIERRSLTSHAAKLFAMAWSVMRRIAHSQTVAMRQPSLRKRATFRASRSTFSWNLRRQNSTFDDGLVVAAHPL